MSEATAAGSHNEAASGTDVRADDRLTIFRELRDSAVLIGMTLSTMGAYLGLGAVMVRLFANR